MTLTQTQLDILGRMINGEPIRVNPGRKWKAFIGDKEIKSRTLVAMDARRLFGHLASSGEWTYYTITDLGRKTWEEANATT